MALGQKLREAREKMKLTPAQVASATRMKMKIVEDIEAEEFSRFPAPIYGKGFIRLYAEHVGLDPRPLILEYMSRFAVPSLPSLKADTDKAGAKKVETPEFPEMTRQLPPPSPEPALPPLPEAPPPTRDPVEQAAEPDLFAAPPPAPAVPEAQDQPSPVVRDPEPETGADWGEIVGALRERREALASRWQKRMRRLRGAMTVSRDPWRRREFSPALVQFLESPIKWLAMMIVVIVIVVFLVSAVSRAVRRQASAEPKKSPVPAAQEKGKASLRLATEPPAPYAD